MGQFSVKIYTSPGSLLNANQHAEISFAIYFVHGYIITSFGVLYARVTTGALVDPSAPFPPSLAGMLLFMTMIVLVSTAIISAGQYVLGKRSRMIIGA